MAAKSVATTVVDTVVIDNAASCQVDGRMVFSCQAERLLHGHVGLWTKANAGILFFDLVVEDGDVRADAD